MHQRSNPAPQARNQPQAHPQPQPQPEKRLRLPPLSERPTFTSKKLSNPSDLRDALDAWHASFESDGPFRDDVESLSGYLGRVVLEERDVDKAVSVVNWLAWLVGDGKSEGQDEVAQNQSENLEGSSQSAVSWDQALQILRDGVGDAVQARGLPPVEFD